MTFSLNTIQIEPADLIAGRAVPLHSVHGLCIRSHNPADPAQTIWEANACNDHVPEALKAARSAAAVWSMAPIEQRERALNVCRELFVQRAEQIASLICAETGKAMWEAKAEAGLLPAKIATVLMAGMQSDGAGRARIDGYSIKLTDTRTGVCRFKPHGVMVVLGPFNFPMHLPNGHIVPALLAGNTIVFKPSDKTPACGQLLIELFNEALTSAGAPPGVVNLVHGGADVAQALVNHDEPDGILFTGSWPVGRSILEANLDRPGRMIALEMGGNNPAVVMPDADLAQAVIECARASFATTGQRCTCTRRIIVHESIFKPFTAAFAKVASTLIVGDPQGVAGEQPFMGPLIRQESVDAALRFQQELQSSGGEIVLEATEMDSPTNGSYITPGIVRLPHGAKFSVTENPAIDCGCDTEVFAPIVRISACKDIDDAIELANATRYGLAASIFTRDERSIERFLNEARAGCINVNTGTAGASGKLPFGGVGWSGNHRPAGAFSPDYCAYPVATMNETGDAAPLSPGMHVDPAWLQ